MKSHYIYYHAEQSRGNLTDCFDILLNLMKGEM